MRFALVLVFVGCGDSQPSTPTSAPQPAVACDALDRNACLTSTACTLVHIDGATYECRREQGACEEGHVQTDEVDCKRRAGCVFKPAGCYCACKGYGKTKIEDTTGPSCKCECGFGAPSACVAGPS